MVNKYINSLENANSRENKRFFFLLFRANFSPQATSVTIATSGIRITMYVEIKWNAFVLGRKNKRSIFDFA